MDVRIDVFRAVELDNPVNLWEIDTSWSNIGGKEHSRLLLNKVEVYSCTLGLLLSTVELQQVIAELKFLKCLKCEPNLLTSREEYQALGLLVALKETEKNVQLLLDVYYHVVVEEFYWSDRLELIT